jgi:hypothetical protein
MIDDPLPSQIPYAKGYLPRAAHGLDPRTPT